MLFLGKYQMNDDQNCIFMLRDIWNFIFLSWNINIIGMKNKQFKKMIWSPIFTQILIIDTRLQNEPI